MDAAAAEDEEEEEEFEYPEELNEFLEYCVGEHGDDWEAISRDFLDVASELDESLADRAHQCFSPEALRRHWIALAGEGGDEPEAPGGTGTEAERPAAATSSSASAPSAPPAAVQAEAAIPPATSGKLEAEEEKESEVDPAQAPSSFSIFRDSLKNRVDQIYLDVQSRLPSTLEVGEDSDEDLSSLSASPPGSGRAEDGRPPLFAPPPRPGAGSGDARPADQGAAPAEPPPGASSAVAATAGGGGGGWAPARSDGAFGGAGLLSAIPASKEQALRQQAMQLFGTDDINQILMGAALQGRHVSEDMPSFDTVLLAHGVNPNDIEGPLVQPPGIIAGLCQGSPEGEGGTAADDPAGERRREPSLAAPGAAPSGVARHPAPKAKQAPTGMPGRPRPPGSPASAEGGQQPADPDPEDDDESEASADSVDEDFAAMRRAMKASSAEASKGQPPPPRPAAPQPVAPGDKAARAQPRPPQRPQKDSRFVKLELVEEDSDSESAEEEDDDGPELGAEDPDEADDADEGVRIMSRLLKRAPGGECAWDVWLDAVRKWPRLQLSLGSPDFIRRNNEELRVSFDVEKLRSLVDDERRACEERRRKQKEEAASAQENIERYIREAERRRELLHGKLGGGFVLAPRDPSLEERQRQRQDAREAAEEGKRQQEAEQRQQEAEQRQRAEEARARKDAERADREAEKKQREESQRQARLMELQRRKEEVEAREFEARLERLQSEVKHHRLPLFDRQTSCGPPLSGVSDLGAAFLDGVGEACGVYVLPWGTPGGGLPARPSSEQLQAACALHRRGLAEGLLLVGPRDLAAAGAGEACDAAVIVLVRRAAREREERLPSGQPLWELLAGPLPEHAARLFRRPLALWALDANGGADSLGAVVPSSEETVCVALPSGSSSDGEAAIAAIVAELQEEGLSVVGMRIAFPDAATVQAATSVSLRSAARPGQPVLLLAVRGPHALCIWRYLLGPVDPQLARRTDPTSLNARFGGAGRHEAVAFAPPSSSSRAHVDVVWAFGGRVAAGRLELPPDPLHAILLAKPRMYSLELPGQLPFASAGAVLSGMLFRMGHVVSLSFGISGDSFVATAVREGGDAFVHSCTRLLMAPPVAAGDSPSTPVARRPPEVHDLRLAADPCEIPHGLGLALNAAELPPAGPSIEEAGHFGQPEIVVVGVRPRGPAATVLLLREVCDDLFAKFGPDGGHGPGSQAKPPGLSVGFGVDLLGVRLFDSRSIADVAAGAGAGAAAALESGMRALRRFRSFAQVMRRAGDGPSEGWWSTELGGPVALLCLHGESLIERFKSFLSREWKLTAVASGDIFFSPDLQASHQACHAFFAGVGPGLLAPTFAPEDLRSAQRFSAMQSSRSSSATPQVPVPQLTAAVLLPPTADAALFRVLTAVEQHEFRLVAALVSGGLTRSTAKLLFDQEVADGHLEVEDWDSFSAAAGCCDEDEVAEGEFRCIWLVLSRPHAVKKLAQLCGHGDPAVNQRYLYASLRTGRGRVQNGIRCATSRASAEVLIGALGRELGTQVVPPGPPCGRRLGVEEGQRALECILIAAAPADGDLSVAHLLRELHTTLTERGLSVVGLRALGGGASAAAAVWPELQGGLPDLLGRWQDARPAAAGVVQRARDGGPLLLAACEGPRCADHVRAASLAASSWGSRGGLELYVSATPGEGAADVVHFFNELFGAKHYIVEGDM